MAFGPVGMACHIIADDVTVILRTYLCSFSCVNCGNTAMSAYPEWLLHRMVFIFWTLRTTWNIGCFPVSVFWAIFQSLTESFICQLTLLHSFIVCQSWNDLTRKSRNSIEEFIQILFYSWSYETHEIVFILCNDYHRSFRFGLMTFSFSVILTNAIHSSLSIRVDRMICEPSIKCFPGAFICMHNTTPPRAATIYDGKWFPIISAPSISGISIKFYATNYAFINRCVPPTLLPSRPHYSVMIFEAHKPRVGFV